ncbi:MAG: hypothetical protein V3V55_01395 [Rhodospirillales bacterium]
MGATIEKIGRHFDNAPQPFAKKGFVGLKNESCAQGKRSHHFSCNSMIDEMF